MAHFGGLHIEECSYAGEPPPEANGMKSGRPAEDFTRRKRQALRTLFHRLGGKLLILHASHASSSMMSLTDGSTAQQASQSLLSWPSRGSAGAWRHPDSSVVVFVHQRVLAANMDTWHNVMTHIQPTACRLLRKASFMLETSSGSMSPRCSSPVADSAAQVSYFCSTLCGKCQRFLCTKAIQFMSSVRPTCVALEAE